MNLRQTMTQHRPEGYVGRGDKYLAPMAQDLRRHLTRAQRGLDHDTFRLPPPFLNKLAAVLIEFGEDVRNDVGIWGSFETYNTEFFGVRLPCTLAAAESPQQGGFSAARIQHLLWVLWRHFKPDLIASPDHHDLVALSDGISGRLADLFEGVPCDSGVKDFLGEGNHYGWEIKGKLLWLGTHSYLFRHFFEDYMAGEESERQVGRTDDFVCQECTPWSGLGVIDILAQVLELDDTDRMTLRSWYERHMAPYLVLALDERDGEVRTMRAENLVNEQEHLIRLGRSRCPFQIGNVVLGSLVPWRGEWYWSGAQQVWDKLEKDAVRLLVRGVLEKSSAVAYRYRPDLAERARRRARAHHEEFLQHCGDDLRHYPDGLSLAADMQKLYTGQYQREPKQLRNKVLKRHGLSRPQPSMQFPPEFLDHDQGIGAFSNPDEGQEYMQEFDHVVSGMGKRGQGLTEEESASIRGLVECTAVSPAFVHRVGRDCGHQSIGSVFLIEDFADGDLQYLLRRHKGHFYRRRYAAISFTSGDD